MQPILEPTKKLSEEQIQALGGKGKGLYWLWQHGFHVPEFLVIPSDHLDQFSIQQIPSTWLQGPLAVRSSAKNEDGEAHSFAGIFESVLNVQGEQQLRTAIEQVRQSEQSARAKSYSSQNHLSEKSQISIILQKMIQPEFSGVAFGCHPITGDRNQVWISMTDGLGDKLVSGEVNGEDFLVDAQGKIHAQSAPAQEVPAFLNELASKVREISNLKAAPQDIEWAWAAGKLWLLQVRPITASSEKKSPVYVFDNSNIQESYCGVTTPLTFSFASLAYHKVYDELMKLMNMSPKQIEAAQWRHKHLLAYVHGRVYYNINSWYEGLQYLPHFGRRKEEMETMMGIEEPIDFIQNITLTRKEKLQRVGGMILLLVKSASRFSQLPKMINEFDQWFWNLYKSAELEKLSELNDFEILKKMAQFQKDSLEKWGTPVLNDFRVMMLMGSVKRSLEKAKIQFDLKSLIYGTEMESTKPTVELQEISQIVAKNPAVQAIVLNERGDEALRKIEAEDSRIATIIKEYIWKYGDRVMGELKLETVTMKQDPEQFFVMLRGFLTAGLHQRTQLFSAHQRAELKVSRRVKKQIEKLCAAIAGRELMRLHRTRSFGANRQMFLALGQRWQAKGILADARDIFYLTQDEIFDFGFGRGVTKNLSALVALRKSEQQTYETQPVQSQMHFHFPVGLADEKVRPVTTAASQDGAISGLGCSAGIVEGEVKWVTSPDDISNLSGKILLAERTDPGWTPLFAMVKGVIIERGSILSHSAVIAREMGIPAVVGVKNMTSRLQNGDKVRIDGSTGRISLLERLGDHSGKSGQQQSHQEYSNP